MTLEKYGALLDRVIPFEAHFICADERYIYVFKRRPRCVELSPTQHVWRGAGGNKPLMMMRRDREQTFPDLEEFKDLTGNVDYFLCVKEI